MKISAEMVSEQLISDFAIISPFEVITDEIPVFAQFIIYFLFSTALNIECEWCWYKGILLPSHESLVNITIASAPCLEFSDINFGKTDSKQIPHPSLPISVSIRTHLFPLEKEFEINWKLLSEKKGLYSPKGTKICLK